MKPFAEYVGQEGVKRQLNFLIDSFKQTKVMPFLNFVGARGLGKTVFAREVSKSLMTSEGIKRPFIEINSSTIKGVDQFFEQIFLPKIMDKEITILFDEAHCLPNLLSNTFLTIFNTEKSNQKDFTGEDGMVYPFDFTKQVFMFGTTNAEKMLEPLRDRLESVIFDEYSTDDLQQILQSNLKKYTFDDRAIRFLAEMSRGNARGCIKLSKNVDRFCLNKDIRHFTFKNSTELSFVLNILPYGLTPIERRLLKILRPIGSTTLTTLAAKTMLSPQAVRRDHELYLLKKGFIKIDTSIRYITTAGAAAIELIERLKL